MSREDQRFMEIMDQSISTENGHYCIDLPFRKNDVIMPNNRCLAEQRLKSLKRKFSWNQEFQEESSLFLLMLSTRGMLKQYHKISYFEIMVRCSTSHIMGYTILKRRPLELCLIAVQFSKECPWIHNCSKAQILPTHYWVFWPGLDKNMWLRCRHSGHQVHQVKVYQTNVDFLRFLWWPNGDTTQSLKEYRMKVHLFGAISSPTSSNFALRKLAEDYKDCFPNKVLNSILHNLCRWLFNICSHRSGGTSDGQRLNCCMFQRRIPVIQMDNSLKVLACIPEEHL